MENEPVDMPRSAKVRRTVIFLITIFLLAIFSAGYSIAVAPPAPFPVGTTVTIFPGESLGKVTYDLRNAGLIRSSITFQSIAILLGGERKIIAGDYVFNSTENAIQVAWRLKNGNFGMEEVKITIPEGLSSEGVSTILSQKLSHFNVAEFLAGAKKQEGYLFPDTYFFPPTATTTQIITRMRKNFDSKVSGLNNKINASKHSFADIVIMASLLEAEAKTTNDRQIVAGILWKRISLGMALQVDSTLKYITGRGTADLTVSDLKINSPYNTYTHTGLPPTPINNPGLSSLSSALNPAETKYLYFLTGKDGTMHYAETFEEHVKNKQKYL